jgi:hypothetical protein
MNARGVVTTLAWLVVLMAPGVAQDRRVSDLSVINVMKAAARSLNGATVWRRVPVTDELDLVIAMATPNTEPVDEVVTSGSIWWSETRKLGLLLQNRSQPGQVFLLALEAGPPECSARILRATATDTVISCRGEMSERYPHQKFVYDVRAKALVGRISVDPFLMNRARARTGSQPRAVIVGTDGRRQVEVEFVQDRVPEFRILAVTPEQQSVGSVPYIRLPNRTSGELRFGPSGAFSVVDGLIMEMQGDRQVSYGLPSSTYEEFQKMRPERAKDVEREMFHDGEIGPSQLEGDRLWFGETFYDGEGTAGAGGFGYFDTVEKKYRLFTSPVVAEASVSAIHVEANAIWLALVGHSEWGDGNGGVLRFDRRLETFERFDTTDIGRAFVRVGNTLLLATDGGMSVIRDNQVKEYLIDRTTDGRLRVAAVDR